MFYILTLDSHCTFGPFASRLWARGYAEATGKTSYCIVTDKYMQQKEYLSKSLLLVPSEWRGFDNPRSLPSCIVHVDAGLASGLEQRGSDGFVDFKVWDYPKPNGEFVCFPLSDAEKRHIMQQCEEMY